MGVSLFRVCFACAKPLPELAWGAYPASVRARVSAKKACWAFPVGVVRGALEPSVWSQGDDKQEDGAVQTAHDDASLHDYFPSSSQAIKPRIDKISGYLANVRRSPIQGVTQVLRDLRFYSFYASARTERREVARCTSTTRRTAPMIATMSSPISPNWVRLNRAK